MLARSVISRRIVCAGVRRAAEATAGAHTAAAGVWPAATAPATRRAFTADAAPAKRSRATGVAAAAAAAPAPAKTATAAAASGGGGGGAGAGSVVAATFDRTARQFNHKDAIVAMNYAHPLVFTYDELSKHVNALAVRCSRNEHSFV